jgi:1,4-dihydroxy-2-naphthoyl-CoA hydrolase
VEPSGQTPSPFDVYLGTEWLERDPAAARVRLAVRDELLQSAGLVHGGVLSTLVESVCSRATDEAVAADGMAAMGQALSISFIRPVTEGSIEVTARARHRGRTTWVWDVEISDGEGRLCAIAQMTTAVRPREGN